ncbi:MAG: cysteine desulfurase NifS, partial [bacterium]
LDGIAVATGSACTSGSPQPSHVVDAIPLPETYTPKGFVRVSFGPYHGEDAVDRAVESLEDCVKELRNESVV